MPSRAGRSARGLGSGRGGDAGGRGGEGGHRRPSPVLSGALGGRLRPRRHAELAESPFSSPWGGGLRPRAERRPRGEGARPRGSGGERAAARPDARRSGGPRGTEHGARSLGREGVAAGGRAGGRWRRRRPVGSWRERGAGPLPSVQTTAPTAARLSGLHAQLAKRRVTAAGPLARGCPVELFLKGMASVCSLRDVSWRGFFGGS